MKKVLALCAPAVLLLAACVGTDLSSMGSSSTASADPASGTAETTAQVRPRATGLVSIQSENVAAAGYDPVSQTMTIQFLEGAIYEYAPVPQELWDDFLAAQPHPWSVVGYPRLVQANVPYWRVSW